MSREIEIKQMAEILDVPCSKVILWDGDCGNSGCYECQATHLYNAGYRKATDVAAEIFAEIAEVVHRHRIGDLRVEYIYDKIQEIGNKYTEVTK